MTMDYVLIIKNIRVNCDLRRIHKPRKLARLLPGHAILMFNRKQTIARLITCDHDVFTFYAPERKAFDLQDIQDRLRRFGQITMKARLKKEADRLNRLSRVA